MKQGLAIIVILLILLVWIFLVVNVFRKEASGPKPEPTKTASLKVTPLPSGPEPETFILSGPAEGSRLEQKEVTFRFSGVLPGGEARDLRFETKLEGVDADWRQTSGDSRTIKLPAGAKNYQFLVRAKSPAGRVDSTPAARTFFSNLSNYFGKVDISSLRAGVAGEKIVIRNRGRETIPISSWRVKSNKEENIIPQGVGLFFYGQINPKGSIVLAPGESLVLYSGSGSPGDNLRLNRCVGYLNVYLVNPKFPTNCPHPADLEIGGFSQKCQNFIRDLGTCEIPDANEPTLIDEPDCRDWLRENVNYNACVRNNQRDLNFWGKEWWAWLNLNRFIYGKSADNIRLYDASGALVDRRDY